MFFHILNTALFVVTVGAIFVASSPGALVFATYVGLASAMSFGQSVRSR